MSATAGLVLRIATRSDLPALHRVIESAYRGDSAKQGWTHEADILFDTRTDIATLDAIVADPCCRLIVAERDGVPIGCVQISDRGEGAAYLGLLCIQPTLQACGLGKHLIAEAEAQSRATFGATHMTMSVIEQRVELIAYYQRRGYAPTGRRLDFPVPLDPPLYMTELAKALA